MADSCSALKIILESVYGFVK